MFMYLFFFLACNRVREEETASALLHVHVPSQSIRDLYVTIYCKIKNYRKIIVAPTDTRLIQLRHIVSLSILFSSRIGRLLVIHFAGKRFPVLFDGPVFNVNLCIVCFVCFDTTATKFTKKLFQVNL